MVESVRTDVAVVGGGPAGLTAAVALAERGFDVTLIEASGRLGGMAASIDVGGVRVDLGSHRLHPVATPRVEQLLDDLLGADLQTRPRDGRLRLGDRWVRFPLQPVDLARRLPLRFAARALADTASGPLRRHRTSHGEDTFAREVQLGLGPAMLDWFYGPYATKLWGVTPDRLAGDLARRRIAANSAGRLAAKLAATARRRPSVFRYPRRGYGQIVDTLAARCEQAGVSPRLGRRVDGLAPAETSPELRLDDGTTVAAGRVFWTAPLAALATAVAGAPAGADRLRHRAMVLAYLVFDVDRITPFDAHYLPGLDVLPTRISEPTNYRDGDDPAGRTVLCAEIPCDVGDETWAASPPELAGRIVDDLGRLGIGVPGTVDVHVERLPRVYPVIGPADVAPLDTIHRWAGALPGIATFGRQGLFVADNLHHVMEMALQATECLAADGAWDAPRWSRALDGFAANVVED